MPVGQRGIVARADERFIFRQREGGGIGINDTPPARGGESSGVGVRVGAGDDIKREGGVRSSAGRKKKTEKKNGASTKGHDQALTHSQPAETVLNTFVYCFSPTSIRQDFSCIMTLPRLQTPSKIVLFASGLLSERRLVFHSLFTRKTRQEIFGQNISAPISALTNEKFQDKEMEKYNLITETEKQPRKASKPQFIRPARSSLPALLRPAHVEPYEILAVLVEDLLGLEQLPGFLLLRPNGAIPPLHPGELLPARPTIQPVVFLSLERRGERGAKGEESREGGGGQRSKTSFKTFGGARVRCVSK